MQTFFKTVFILEVCSVFGLCKLPQIQVPKKNPLDLKITMSLFVEEWTPGKLGKLLICAFFPLKVDNNVTRHLDKVLKRQDWDVLILHYLGLDHIGHISGPNSPLIGHKLSEMDSILMKIHTSLLSEVSMSRCQYFLEEMQLLKWTLERKKKSELGWPCMSFMPTSTQATFTYSSTCCVLGGPAKEWLLVSPPVHPDNFSWTPSLSLFLYRQLRSLASSQEGKQGA